jgi:hypothetical protein
MCDTIVVFGRIFKLDSNKNSFFDSFTFSPLIDNEEDADDIDENQENEVFGELSLTKFLQLELQGKRFLFKTPLRCVRRVRASQITKINQKKNQLLVNFNLLLIIREIF